MKRKILLVLTCVAALSTAQVADAAIVIAGSATGYHSTDKDWLTNTTNDIDGNGLGTDGWIFFGDFQVGNAGNTNPNNDGNGNIIGASDAVPFNAGLFAVSAPSYVTNAETVGANSDNIGQFDYEPIDNPLTLDGTDEAAGNLLVTGSGSAVEFTISGLAAGSTVRVGVLGAVLNDDNRARFDAPEISLTDGTSTVSVTGLPNLSDGTAAASLGWVFFDIDADGTYGVAVPPDAGGPAPAVTGLGGLTFDSIAVPEPSSLALLGLGAFGLALRRRK